MEHERRGDRFVEVEDRFAGYQVYDHRYNKIGKVDDLFVSETDEPEYVGVQMGFLGISGTTLIPMDIVRVNDNQQLIRVAAEKETIESGPSFRDDQEITSGFERKVRGHYGIEETFSYAGTGSTYDAYYASEEQLGREREGEGVAGPGMRTGDIDAGEFREHPPEAEGFLEPESDLEDEEELRVGTREREAGAVRVRKRVRTDRERIEVPVRREEVYVERVPAEGEAPETEIGEDEARIPVTEEDVRREEVEVDDETERRER